MITIYDRYQTAFNTNGLGILEITEGVVEEELNGIFKFTGVYPLNERLSDKVIVGATLRIDTPQGQEPFRIWSVNKTNGDIQITAYHISFDLYYHIIEDKNLVTLGAQSALSRLLEDTPFTALSDVSFVSSARVVRKTVQQAIFGDDENSFLPRWGGEFLRTGYTLNAKNFRGRTFSQNPVAIRYGKNLVSYDTEIDESTYYNRIMPVGFNALLIPEIYVDRPGIDLADIRVKIVEYNHIKAISENPQEDELPLADAEQALRDAVLADITAGEFDPQTNHKIEFVDLSSTTEYANKAVLEKRFLGDEVRILNEDGLDVMARVISYRYDPITSEYISMELGNYQEKPMNIISQVDLLNRTVLELSSQQITEQHVTDLLTSALGGYVKEINGEMFITDNIDPALALKVWRWNINGLGYSSTGLNGPYGTAITMDGTIIGTFIQAGTISTNEISNTASIRLVANTTVEINEFGLTIDDGVSATVGRHTGEGSSYIDRITGNPFANYSAGGADFDELNVKKVYSPHVANKVSTPTSVYVDSTPTGDFTGRDASNKAGTVDKALQTALDSALVLDEDVTIYLAADTFGEDIRIEGLSGRGKLHLIGFYGSTQFAGSIRLKNCTNTILLEDLTVYSAVASSEGLIHAEACTDVRIHGARLDGANNRPAVSADRSLVTIEAGPIANCTECYKAENLSQIYAYDTYGQGNAVCADSDSGSRIIMAYRRPQSTTASAVSNGGTVTDDATPTASTFSITPPVFTAQTKTFTAKLSSVNIASGYTWSAAKWTQGTYEGTSQKGVADFGSLIKTWLESAGGYQNISSVIIRAHRLSGSGGSAPVSFKIGTPSAQSLPAVGYGATSQATLIAALVTAMTSGALKLQSTTTATADYAAFDKVEIIVTAEKKA